MVDTLVNLSNWIIPLIMVAIILYGLLKGVDVFEAFTAGAMDGIKICLEILPTLIGLLVAIGMLRASGSLTALTNALSPLLKHTHFPPDCILVSLLHSFSGSASTSFIIDIFRISGPDSLVGRVSSIIVSSTETIFYTMSVYFMAIKVTKSRYTLGVSIISIASGVVFSYILTVLFFGY